MHEIAHGLKMFKAFYESSTRLIWCRVFLDAEFESLFVLNVAIVDKVD